MYSKTYFKYFNPSNALFKYILLKSKNTDIQAQFIISARLKVIYLIFTQYQIYLNQATYLDYKYITKSKYTKYTYIQAQTNKSIISKVIITALFKNPKIPNTLYPDTDFNYFPFKYLNTYLIKYVLDILGVRNNSATFI